MNQQEEQNLVLDQTDQTSRGASWTYATQWSFHPREMISFIYPYYFGLQNTQDLKREPYWGYMSFTQSHTLLGYNCYFIGHFRSTAEKTSINLKYFFG